MITGVKRRGYLLKVKTFLQMMTTFICITPAQSAADL